MFRKLFLMILLFGIIVVAMAHIDIKNAPNIFLQDNHYNYAQPETVIRAVDKKMVVFLTKLGAQLSEYPNIKSFLMNMNNRKLPITARNLINIYCVFVCLVIVGKCYWWALTHGLFVGNGSGNDPVVQNRFMPGVDIPKRSDEEIRRSLESPPRRDSASFRETVITDNVGRALATYRETDYEIRIHEYTGKFLAYYNKDDDRTYDCVGRLVGTGNLTGRFIPKEA